MKGYKYCKKHDIYFNNRLKKCLMCFDYDTLKITMERLDTIDNMLTNSTRELLTEVEVLQAFVDYRSDSVNNV